MTGSLNHISDHELDELERTTRQDDWHLQLVGSDVRRLIAEIRRLHALHSTPDRGLEKAAFETAMHATDLALENIRLKRELAAVKPMQQSGSPCAPAQSDKGDEIQATESPGGSPQAQQALNDYEHGAQDGQVARLAQQHAELQRGESSDTCIFCGKSHSDCEEQQADLRNRMEEVIAAGRGESQGKKCTCRNARRTPQRNCPVHDVASEISNNRTKAAYSSKPVEFEGFGLTENDCVWLIECIEDEVYQRKSWNGGTVLAALLERYDVRPKP